VEFVLHFVVTPIPDINRANTTDCNVLCLGSRVTGVELALDIVRAFVAARFTGEARHKRESAKITELETSKILEITRYADL
jgi:ribose 5-phosphate isomerase RpiB